jgi:alcohol dehydrogenase (NADP+)
MAGTRILPRPPQAAEAAGPIPVKGYAAFSPDSPLVPWEFERRAPGPRDVLVDILFCGICHTDVHLVRNEWGISLYPMVPGHEIVGTVASVGSEVRKWKAGDSCGIGCFVDSCRDCGACRDGDEQYCEKGVVMTYSGRERDGQTVTQGGYSTGIVVNEDYVYRLPRILPLDRTAPLMCAGITTYSPLKRAGLREGDDVAIAGLGGLGHMGVKFAKAMGANVTVLSTSPSKREDALQLGADEFIATRDPDAFVRNATRFHFILDTIAAKHDINSYARMLRRNGRLVQVGAPPDPLSLAVINLIQNRRSIGGSMIGGLRETQEMLDFCGKNGIAAEVEVIPIQKVGEAYERMVKSDVKYRFVIDLSSLKGS